MCELIVRNDEHQPKDSGHPVGGNAGDVTDGKCHESSMMTPSDSFGRARDLLLRRELTELMQHLTRSVWCVGLPG